MDDYLLIREVEKRVQLYDHSDPKYKDKRQRDAGWRAVSEAVGITVVKCQGRWKDLRDQFSKKSLQPRSGSAAGPQKEWKYTQALSFLIPHLQPRSSRSNLDQVEDWEALDLSHGEDVREENDHQPDQHSQPGSSTNRPYSRPAARKRASAPLESLEDRLLAMVQEPPQHMHHRVPQEEDEMLHFALSLVPLLNKLSGWGKLRAKIALLEGLQGVHDLDQGHQQAQMQGPGLIRPWDQTSQPSHQSHQPSHQSRQPQLLYAPPSHAQTKRYRPSEETWGECGESTVPSPIPHYTDL
ncbi:uncharacterized protein LOC130381836 [Gadus chalcogrammus]|uniref:uncharacterized protein LOC130381836 n=1 Tax=Gadus chalcogrammus TaxID=1042646 RepID=UPI0024C256B7|nr:uncharacterized protein LOC130381836 [Gadus chalcogrammus]